jgi:hypothetical protein
VLKVQMPAGPDEARFFGAILDELGFPHMLSRETGVQALVIDELHNVFLARAFINGVS